jgi:thymidylate synthase
MSSIGSNDGEEGTKSMKPEPLQKKKTRVPSMGTVYAEDVLSSAVQFYKRYRNNVSLLMKEQRKIWKQWIDFFETSTEGIQSQPLRERHTAMHAYLDAYNEWLFDISFSDIIDATFQL